MKKSTLRPIVTRNKIFSIPRRAVKIPPVSAPVSPPNPAPLLCKITLTMRAIDVIIKAIFRYNFTSSSAYCHTLDFKQADYTFAEMNRQIEIGEERLEIRSRISDLV
jgi:hypothetical protein